MYWNRSILSPITHFPFKIHTKTSFWVSFCITFIQNTLKNWFWASFCMTFTQNTLKNWFLSVILYYFHSKYTQKYLLCVILCGFHYKYTQNRPIFGLFFTINALKIAFWGLFWVIFVCYPCFSLKIHTKLVFCVNFVWISLKIHSKIDFWAFFVWFSLKIHTKTLIFAFFVWKMLQKSHSTNRGTFFSVSPEKNEHVREDFIRKRK